MRGSYLLNFLIDCGWNHHLDTSILQPLSRVASTVDAVLLSHPDTLHLKQVSDFDLFTLNDIDDAFKTVTTLTYSQNHHISEATEHLKEHCMDHVCRDVYAPQLEESIDVTSDLCAYKVQLSEQLMSNVLFKKLGDNEVAWLDAQVEKTENGMLSILPLSRPAPPHKTVLVGDLKMADFKRFLASKGVQVEFAGGVLRCGEYVTLCKVGDSSQKGGAAAIQQIILEGPLSEEYYKIRDHLYSQFYAL